MRKTIIFTIIIIGLLVGGAFSYQYYNEQKLKNLTAGVLTINEVPIVVEIANSSEKRIRGLSGRESLPEKSGMLFAFANPGFYEFWMKEMKIPLDTIWFDKGFKVVDITEQVLPETYPKTFTSKEKASYAVEVNSGFVQKYVIKIGDRASFEVH